jgi:hypothetical protein
MSSGLEGAVLQLLHPFVQFVCFRTSNSKHDYSVRVAIELLIDSSRLLHVLQLWRGIFMCSELCNI